MPSIQFGTAGSLPYRMIFLDEEQKQVSPWHGIPLHSDKSNLIFNFVCTTPKGTCARLRFATEEPFHPSHHIENLSTPSPAHYAENARWNYGLLPQTWTTGALTSSGGFAERFGGLPLSSTPLEVIEMGSRISDLGEVYPVRPVAVFAVINPGETNNVGPTLSWRILAVAADDPMADLKQLTVVDEVKKWPQTCHFVGAGPSLHPLSNPSDRPSEAAD